MNPPAATRHVTLPGAFALESGTKLPEITVAYRSWGTLDREGTNAVLVCHPLTCSADVAEWWPALLGPGRALDPERDLVLCSNVLGGCYGSTGPTSLRPGAGGRWGGAFPRITIRDMVAVQREALAALGVRRLRLVVGGSLGGMQALEWAVSFPDVVDAAVAIAAPGRHSAWAIALGAAQRAAVATDPRFCSGRYPADAPPRAGLATARMIAMCSYRSPASLQRRFDRASDAGGRFAVESYMLAHGERLVARFDANSYLTLTAAMDTHDLERDRPWPPFAGAAPVPALLVAIASDVLYLPDEIAELAARLPGATLARLDSPHGHDAFLIEGEEVNRLLLRFRATVQRGRRIRRGAVPRARVMKFGGTSVADAQRQRHVAALVAEAASRAPIAVVVSALAGVTDDLARLAHAAEHGAGWREAADRVVQRHHACARELEAGQEAHQALIEVGEDLVAALAAVAGSPAPDPALRDAVLACGERLSLVLAATALAAAGLDPEPWDARRLVVTDSGFGGASVAGTKTAAAIRRAWLGRRRGSVAVLGGFIAADRHGRTTTLGRGGSDLTASLVAAAINAAVVEIWTDVDGVLSAPPQTGIMGHTLPQLSYGEAEQLARHGGKVLHPATMGAAAARGIPIVVRNTFNPEGPATTVSRVPSGTAGVAAVSALAELGRVALVGPGAGRLTLAARRELGRAGIPVLASAATGPACALTVDVPPAATIAAVAALHTAFVAPGCADAARRRAAGR